MSNMRKRYQYRAYLLARGWHLVTKAPIPSNPITAAALFAAGPTMDVEALFRNMYSKYLGRNVAKPTTANKINVVVKMCST